MQIPLRPLLTAFAIPLFLPACAGIPGESPEHMRERMERQDKLVDRRQEKRKIRSEAADRHYDQWWNNAVGKPNDPQAWKQTY